MVLLMHRKHKHSLLIETNDFVNELSDRHSLFLFALKTDSQVLVNARVCVDMKFIRGEAED